MDDVVPDFAIITNALEIQSPALKLRACFGPDLISLIGGKLFLKLQRSRYDVQKMLTCRCARGDDEKHFDVLRKTTIFEHLSRAKRARVKELVTGKSAAVDSRRGRNKFRKKSEITNKLTLPDFAHFDVPGYGQLPPMTMCLRLTLRDNETWVELTADVLDFLTKFVSLQVAEAHVYHPRRQGPGSHVTDSSFDDDSEIDTDTSSPPLSTSSADTDDATVSGDSASFSSASFSSSQVATEQDLKDNTCEELAMPVQTARPSSVPGGSVMAQLMGYT